MPSKASKSQGLGNQALARQFDQALRQAGEQATVLLSLMLTGSAPKSVPDYGVLASYVESLNLEEITDAVRSRTGDVRSPAATTSTFRPDRGLQSPVRDVYPTAANQPLPNPASLPPAS